MQSASATFCLVFICLCFLQSVYSFYHVQPVRQVRMSSRASLTMSDDMMDPNGYGPMGTLVRQGPVPFLIRIAKPDTYNAAVDKYMALEKCDRLTAMANMDAYFQDPNGWAAEKLRAKKTGVSVDYTKMNTDKSSLVLTAVWAVGILGLFFRIFQVQVLNQ